MEGRRGEERRRGGEKEGKNRKKKGGWEVTGVAVNFSGLVPHAGSIAVVRVVAAARPNDERERVEGTKRR